MDIIECYNHLEDEVIPITGGMARIGEWLFTLTLHVIATLRIRCTFLHLVFFSFFHFGGEWLYSMQDPVLVNLLISLFFLLLCSASNEFLLIFPFVRACFDITPHGGNIEYILKKHHLD